VPSWATPASAGSLTLLSTTTLSGATVTISGISGAYTNLMAFVFGVTNATVKGDLQVAPNGVTNLSDGTFSTSSTALGSGGNRYVLLSGQGATTQSVLTSTNNSYVMTINNYASTTSFKTITSFGANEDSGASPQTTGRIYFGQYKSLSAITSLVFNNTGGNLSTGTVLLYGVK
jgi:hypothetical protein